MKAARNSITNFQPALCVLPDLGHLLFIVAADHFLWQRREIDGLKFDRVSVTACTSTGFPSSDTVETGMLLISQPSHWSCPKQHGKDASTHRLAIRASITPEWKQSFGYQDDVRLDNAFTL